MDSICNCQCEECRKQRHCGIGFPTDGVKAECTYKPSLNARKVVYADGGAHGNGTATAKTYGSFCVDGEMELHRLTHCGNTNNEAEYHALIAALEYCKAHRITPQVKMDSALVVNQVTDRWRVKEDHLRPHWFKAKALLKEVGGTIAWIDNREMKRILGH